MFRLTWSLADTIVFLILSKDGGNSKDQQDRNHSILLEDAADALWSALRDARRKAREEEDILLPAAGSEQFQKSQLPPRLHSCLAPVYVDEESAWSTENISPKSIAQSPTT
ncbi:hypothetical protein BDN71DRAFT_1512804 [Pleurotus eryngii]|uniref:Uncharacterized protein n=1 Tax=Pleurotus eryngii TaxID=5323 RepID=A0A9P5ZKH1_PLEER|nr:hypothetical protein BDN71DRAFT_1512804 [Pleurotus eryngii]